MKRRITISLEADLERRIRNKQACLLLKSNHSVSFSEMLNRIVREALKNDNSEVDSEQAETTESMMVKAKNSRMYSKMMESMPKNSQASSKEMEIESKLNSIYNRLA